MQLKCCQGIAATFCCILSKQSHATQLPAKEQMKVACLLTVSNKVGKS